MALSVKRLNWPLYLLNAITDISLPSRLMTEITWIINGWRRTAGDLYLGCEEHRIEHRTEVELILFNN